MIERWRPLPFGIVLACHKLCIFLSISAVSDPVSDTTVDHIVDGFNRASHMDADEFQLRAAESDESL